MYKKPEYRKQDIIRETIKALVTDSVTWEQACDLVHAQFTTEGLVSSAAETLLHKQRGEH